MPDDSARENQLPEESEKIVRIVLIEDHAILRDGLRSLLEMESDFRVVGEAESCAGGLEILRTLTPDLVITDIGLPDRSGLTVIPEIKELYPSIRVLVLTAHCTDEFVRAALEYGADGYVLKDATRAELMTGIRRLLYGEQYFSEIVTSRVVSGFLHKNDDDSKQNSALTPREVEVMKLIATALSTKQIARRLNVSVKTVEKHRSNLMSKLNLRSSVAVTLYAVQNNLVSPDLATRSRGDS